MFELIIQENKEKKNQPRVSLGLRLEVAGYETVCPVTGSVDDFKTFETEVKSILGQLDGIKSKARELFERSSTQGKLGLRPNMTPGEIWTILSAIKDDNEFSQSFNSLDEAKRREVAEYILTKCNIFSGKAAVFSSRYDEATAMMA
jgi:hypothetical protein